MAYTTIDDPSAYFQTALWSGDDATTQNITNDGNSDLQPDWVWVKCRNTQGNGFSHNVWDTSRGVDNNVNKSLFPDVADSEGGGDTITTTAQLGGVSAMLSDGFTVREGSTDNDSRYVNENSRTYVGWQWKANGGTTTTNDASSTGVGTIDSVYQANTTAGFSIVTYTGTGRAGTIAHGLGVAPTAIIGKDRSDTSQWFVQHPALGATHYGELDDTTAFADDANYFNDSTPTSTVFGVGSDGATGGTTNYVAYCFAPIKGYSHFGKYTGNANADGPFAYTGFKPAWLLIKNNTSGEGWMLHDTTVDNATTQGNPVEQRFQVNENQTEVGTTNAFDFLSNGFKVRTDTTSHNGSGHTIVYFAFAEHPFVSSKGVPTTAR